jgi:AraC-like DNA-binding protein
VEVFRCSALPPRAERHGVDLHAALRPDFHQLIALYAGKLTCSVDFTEHVLAEGNWLWIRPGQVRQYRSGIAGAEGVMVLFQSDYLDAATARAARIDEPGTGRPIDQSGSKGTTEREVLALLQRQHDNPSTLPPELYAATMRHLLAVLVLRLANASGRDDGVAAGGETFRRFRLAVETEFARTRRVEDYAQLLGYSVRTLTRVTQEAVGCAAKAYIDDRVLLEAKRLLVHSDLAAQAIGQRIGFSEGTAFARFFRQRAGLAPASFRSQARGTH